MRSCLRDTACAINLAKRTHELPRGIGEARPRSSWYSRTFRGGAEGHVGRFARRREPRIRTFTMASAPRRRVLREGEGKHSPKRANSRRVWGYVERAFFKMYGRNDSLVKYGSGSPEFCSSPDFWLGKLMRSLSQGLDNSSGISAPLVFCTRHSIDSTHLD